MRVIVCGGRDFSDRALLFSTLNEVLRSYRPSEIRIIHGAARGADSLAAEYAKSRHLSESPFPADWKAFGPGAGPIRNEQMLREGNPDLVVAFPGGKGTADMVSRAMKAEVKIVRVTASGCAAEFQFTKSGGD
jgi:cysteine synthase